MTSNINGFIKNDGYYDRLAYYDKKCIKNNDKLGY